MEAWFAGVLQWLALPQFGLSTVFVVALVSATLLPMGSEPAVFGLIKLNPDLFWPAILVATAGNALGGAVNWWMGFGAKRAYESYKHSSVQAKALAWLEKLGPRACFLPSCRSSATRSPPSPAGLLPFWRCFSVGCARQIPALRGDDGGRTVDLAGQFQIGYGAHQASARC